MGEGEVVLCLWAWDGDRGCVVCVCVFCFSSLVGSGIYANMNRRWSGSRGIGLCNESTSSFKAGGDV